VIEADGEVRQFPRLQVRLRPGPEELEVAKLGTGRSVRTAVASNGQPYRMVAVPIRNAQEALVLGRPLRQTNLILSSLWLVLVIFGAAGVVWAAIAGSAVARSGLRPVRRLTEAAEHVAATDDLTPISFTGNDELSRLADSFNQMLRSLALSRERQKQLIADTGHELRTPLTSLRTNIELLVADEEHHNLPPAARQEILGDVSAQLAEFTSLIGDLVQLARDDQVTPAPEPIDFRNVVNAALERARRRGPGLRFDVELNPFWVIGEADTLERAITNLLDNAVKWSPPGGTIRVQLEGDRLRVADEGPGIAEKDLPYIFDRFYRADSSRNTPGTGLGLSIVAQTVARHGGTVRAGRSAQGGAEFTVRLPGSTTFEGLATR
jgi:two-component system sensor histidine kinase MprB